MCPCSPAPRLEAPDDPHDLFDVSSIPGIEDLTRTGQVPANPAALEAARAQLDAAIAAEPTTGTGAVLPVARSARRRWAHRSLAVAAALALLPLGRIALDTARPDVARVAIAADGSLQCSNEGYAAPIAPRDADLRLLPAALPDGWQLDRIAARWSTSDDPAACRVPALTLVRLDDDRVITGDVTVHGPFAEVDAESFLGSRSTVQVAGVPGLLLDSSDAGFQRWVWTSDEHTWVMEARELTADEGELVAAGITTTGTDPDWQPTGDDLGSAGGRPAPRAAAHLPDRPPGVVRRPHRTRRARRALLRALPARAPDSRPRSHLPGRRRLRRWNRGADGPTGPGRGRDRSASGATG